MTSQPLPTHPQEAGLLAQTLRQGAQALQLVLSDTQQQALLDYLALLVRWNQVYNLTAVREAEQMLIQHVLDSLAVVPPLQSHTGGQPLRVLDVGAGAGLPSVVLAIACPFLQIDAVDTVGKKVAFITQVAAQLKLSNLRGLHNRVEQLGSTHGYQVITSRAFASLADFVTGSRGALAPDGVWMAMKGRPPEAELAALPADVDVFHVERLVVPGLDAERCLVWMRPRGEPG